MITSYYEMTKKIIIERTLNVINQLPVEKSAEIADFADFLFKKYEEHILSSGIQKLATESKSYDFLENETDDYTIADLKEIYNDKG